MSTPSRCFFLGTLIIILLVPFAVRAQALDWVQQEISALLIEITELQEQIASLSANSTPTAVAPSPGAPPVQTAVRCPSLHRSLARDTSGPDVVALQLFLSDEGLFSANATGFFGPVTEAAVRGWQARRGVVSSGDAMSTGWGVVGPRTRAAILNRCVVSANRPTIPVASSVPASCPIAPPPATICGAGWQAVTDQYGCTTSYKCTVPLTQVTQTNTCPQYQRPLCPNGVLLSSGTDLNGCGLGYQCVTQGYCASDVTNARDDAAGKVCAQSTMQLTCPHDSAYQYSAPNGCEISFLQSRAWRVVNTTIGTLSASPSSGTAPLTVSFVLANGRSGCGQETQTLEFGDGADHTVLPLSGSACELQTLTIQHTYTVSGTYAAKLTSQGRIVSSTTVTVQ